MNSGESMTNDVDVDLGRLFASLKENWWRILVVSLLISATVFVLLTMITPRYRAETRVLIESRESVFTRPQGATQNDSAVLDAQGVTSQVQVITSAEILTRVAREFDLASRPEFGGSQPSLLDRLLIGLGLTSGPSGLAPDARVLTAFREKLEVYQVQNSRVIVIQFSSVDPQLAAEVPNAIADAYVASLRETEKQSNATATEWLEPEITDLRQQVREAEARVAAFRTQSDLLIGQNNTVLATQQLAELSSELSRVRANRAATEANAESIRAAIDRGAEIDSLPDVLSSGLIQNLRERQVDLETQIADLSTTLLDNHPRIRAQRSQLADLSAQIRAEARRVLEGLEIELDSARRRENELTAGLNRLKAESARADEEQVELRALEREATAQRELLESYLTRYREAAARGDRNYLPVDARIFSRAVVPSQPYFPKILPLTIAAFAASILLMVILALLRELFSGRAMRPVERTAEPAPQAAVAPPAEPARDTVAASTAAAVAGGAVAGAATKEAASPGDMDKAPVFGKRGTGLGEVDIESAAESLISSAVARAIFVSPEGDEAAATAVLVAREVADAGLRVLLLDLTASGAASLPMLESMSYRGITDLLASEAQFSDVIHPDLYSACHIVPIGTADRHRAMRAIDRLPIIMSSLTTAYDLVVVECGPADVAAIAPLMEDDAQVLVSVLDPEEERVADLAKALNESGFGAPILVTPNGHVPPPAPPGREVA